MLASDTDMPVAPVFRKANLEAYMLALKREHSFTQNPRGNPKKLIASLKAAQGLGVVTVKMDNVMTVKACFLRLTMVSTVNTRLLIHKLSAFGMSCALHQFYSHNS